MLASDYDELKLTPEILRYLLNRIKSSRNAQLLDHKKTTNYDDVILREWAIFFSGIIIEKLERQLKEAKWITETL